MLLYFHYSGERGNMGWQSHYESPLGPMTLYSEDGKSLWGLWFDGQAYDKSLMDQVEGVDEREFPVFRKTKEWLNIYFQGKDPGWLPELVLTGSPFRKMVAEEMMKIPFGKTVTYGEISLAISKKQGRKSSPRAVGGAVGHNPISLIIPCHRVIGINGKLTGYAGGLNRKTALLKNEGMM